MIPTTDFAVARQNMIDCQIRPNKVTDSVLLEALADVPREVFLPCDISHLAYIDEAVAVAPGRNLLPPTILARMIQALRVRPHERVLVIGGLAGYSAAVLARMGAKVTLLEADTALTEQARRNFNRPDFSKIEVVNGPLTAKDISGVVFDKILVEGAVAEVPQQWFDLMAQDSMLVVVETPDRDVGQAVLMRRAGKDVLFDANAPYIPGFEPKPAFSF